ncbi:MAG: hypothetical protein J0I09_08400 [Sphingobacteriia bacterium]|nr:hypothetical protein [Sphingobacteriia bacterium]
MFTMVDLPARGIARFCILSLFTFFSYMGKTQVNEPTTNEVYGFIYRMAQKGMIEINDFILPLDRMEIAKQLLKIESNKSTLSAKELQELFFYSKEYASDIVLNDSLSKISLNGASILKYDKYNRARLVSVHNINTQLFVDPVLGGNISVYSGKQLSKQYFGGVRIYGYLSKNIGFNFLFRDITENGDSVDIAKTFTPAQGVINTSRYNNSLNYSNINFNLSYKWKNGMLSFSKENMQWGYGESGKIVLSNKAPSFLNINLTYDPFKWLNFSYFHGWLNSDVVDSNASYNTSNGYREVFIKKFIANHSLNFRVQKGLVFSIGESIVYSDKFDLGYLMPFNFFKAYDQYVSSYSLHGGSNGQLFGQISSRNQIKNLHAYLVIFVDEIRLDKIFSKTLSRNQIAYTLGVNKTDLLFKYLSAGLEYTRVRGGVYNNIITAQTYTNNSYVMGDWIGQNADRLYLYAKFTPFAKLKLNSWWQFIRKGRPYTIDEQYYQQPEPPFLNDKLFDQKQYGFSVLYEWLHSTKFFLSFSHTSFVYPSYSSSGSNLNLGFSYGL